MGGIVSTIRDMKIILRDLKITLKYTARIVLKVHDIVEDVEQTVQELVLTVNNLTARASAKIDPSQEHVFDGISTTYLDEVVQSIETTAESVRSSLSGAVGVLTSDGVFRDTSNAWSNLLSHSEKTFPGVMSKWASIPEEIGDLVKQDCKNLTDYLQNAKVGPLVSNDTVGGIKLGTDERQITKRATDTSYTEQPSTMKRQRNLFHKYKMKGSAPRIVPCILIKEISLPAENHSNKLSEIVDGKESKCSSSSTWPALFIPECIESRRDKSITSLHESIQNRYQRSFSYQKYSPEFADQKEKLCLLLMTLLQRIANETAGSHQTVGTSLFGDSNSFVNLSQAAPNEYLACD